MNLSCSETSKDCYPCFLPPHQSISLKKNISHFQVPVDSLNKLMANKEELKKVLERHIVPGVRMEGKGVPDGSTKHISASGDELRTEREKFVKVCNILS